jgi:hypothetical protein
MFIWHLTEQEQLYFYDLMNDVNKLHKSYQLAELDEMKVERRQKVNQELHMMNIDQHFLHEFEENPQFQDDLNEQFGPRNQNKDQTTQTFENGNAKLDRSVNSLEGNEEDSKMEDSESLRSEYLNTSFDIQEAKDFYVNGDIKLDETERKVQSDDMDVDGVNSLNNSRDQLLLEGSVENIDITDKITEDKVKDQDETNNITFNDVNSKQILNSNLHSDPYVNDEVISFTNSEEFSVKLEEKQDEQNTINNESGKTDVSNSAKNVSTKVSQKEDPSKSNKIDNNISSEVKNEEKIVCNDGRNYLMLEEVKWKDEPVLEIYSNPSNKADNPVSVNNENVMNSQDQIEGPKSLDLSEPLTQTSLPWYETSEPNNDIEEKTSHNSEGNEETACDDKVELNKLDKVISSIGNNIKHNPSIEKLGNDKSISDKVWNKANSEKPVSTIEGITFGNQPEPDIVFNYQNDQTKIEPKPQLKVVQDYRNWYLEDMTTM